MPHRKTSRGTRVVCVGQVRPIRCNMTMPERDLLRLLTPVQIRCACSSHAKPRTVSKNYTGICVLCGSAKVLMKQESSHRRHCNGLLLPSMTMLVKSPVMGHTQHVSSR